MNWLDLLLLTLLGFAAVRGFMRGFIVEVCGLVGIVLGIWAGTHFSDRVASWLDLGSDSEVVPFLTTFIGVLVLVQLLARAITKAMDLAELSLPNKVAGVLFGVVRKAFVLSVVLNVLFAREEAGWPPDKATREGSSLHGPVKSFAPLIVPALKRTKWIKRALDALPSDLRDPVTEVSDSAED